MGAENKMGYNLVSPPRHDVRPRNSAVEYGFDRAGKVSGRMGDLTAWGDESVRILAREPMYLLAACILEEKPLTQISELEKLVPSHSQKIHWRDMGVNVQGKALRIIAEIPQSTCIVIASPIKPEKQERARRKCLEVLLAYLESKGIETLILESRGEYLDKKDIDFLFYLRRSNFISTIDVSHAQGASDKCLCVPDQILGAYGELTADPCAVPKWLDDWNVIAEKLTTMQVIP